MTPAVGGTVTGVSASAPLASSGGTAPNISLTGTVPVANGGTGQTSLTTNGIVFGQGAGAVWRGFLMMYGFTQLRQVRLFDWAVITDLDETFTDAQLKVQVAVKNYSQQLQSGYTVKAVLVDQNGHAVTEFTSKAFDVAANGKTEVSLSTPVTNPAKWTAETPTLYRLKLMLQGRDNVSQDQASVTMGFKETQIKGEVFYLNGVAIKVNAMNSHMQHPDLGHAMDEATIRRDFEILKQFNFNAVRTSHYPPVNRYLELANEYGLYIIDEAGTEAHATEFLSERAEFREMYKERVRRMVLRDRNHPCVLFWSAGNESGNGVNISEVIAEGKRLDPTRFWMYGGNAFSHPAEDIIGPRYPSPEDLERQIGKRERNEDVIRPSFMDEYLSVAGNGGGGMDEYWDVIYRYPRIMGGAIWDYISPGLTQRIRQVIDASPHRVPAHLMGNAKRVSTDQGMVLDLNGHDQWVEVYRDDAVEIDGDQLTLSLDVLPRALVSQSGTFITKTIAPETGSDRLRRVINKTVTNDEILDRADLIFASGIENLKLYYMIGLPTETDEDLVAIRDLTLQMRDRMLKHARVARARRPHRRQRQPADPEARHGLPVAADGRLRRSSTGRSSGCAR